MVACGSIGAIAHGGDSAVVAQSNPAGSSASPRVPVPFERKAPASTSSHAPDTPTPPGRTASGSTVGEDVKNANPGVGLHSRAAKAAVEADGYKRVTILGPGPNGTWRAKGYRGDMEVGLNVAADGSVTID